MKFQVTLLPLALFFIGLTKSEAENNGIVLNVDHENDPEEMMLSENDKHTLYTTMHLACTDVDFRDKLAKEIAENGKNNKMEPLLKNYNPEHKHLPPISNKGKIKIKEALEHCKNRENPHIEYCYLIRALVYVTANCDYIQLDDSFKKCYKEWTEMKKGISFAINTDLYPSIMHVRSTNFHSSYWKPQQMGVIINKTNDKRHLWY